MNIFRKILIKISEIKKIFIERALIINYKKVDSIPKIKAGYVDIDAVAARYEASLRNISVPMLLRDLSIIDNFYFLEHECKKYADGLLDSAKLLDIGCGSGVYLKVFKREESPYKNIKYIGTEINEKFTQMSKKYLPEGEFITTFADNINLSDNSIDFVFCSSTLHYTLENWKKSLDEMKRVSKEFVAITRFPVAKYNKTFFVHQTVRGVNGAENHYFIVINRKELEEYFEKIGFEILKRDYSSQEYKIDGVDEKIVLIQYLLKKNGN